MNQELEICAFSPAELEALVAEFAACGLALTMGHNLNYKPTATAKKIKSKSMYAKPVFNHYFKNETHRATFLKEELKNLKNQAAAKAAQKEAVKAARENMKNPFEVGQILYDSWGYEQTNIDFYQVIEVKEKSIVIQEIAGEMMPSEGFSSMSAFVKPVANEFTGEPIVKPICVRVWEGKATYFIKSRHGWISPYEKGEKGVYCSWYA